MPVSLPAPVSQPAVTFDKVALLSFSTRYNKESDTTTVNMSVLPYAIANGVPVWGNPISHRIDDLDAFLASNTELVSAYTTAKAGVFPAVLATMVKVGKLPSPQQA